MTIGEKGGGPGRPARVAAGDRDSAHPRDLSITRGERLLLAAGLVVCLGLRLHGLGAGSLSLDEGYTWNKVHLPWSDIVWRITDIHPPLFYVVVKGLLPFGDETWWLRLPSVVFGVSGCLVIWMIGRRFGGRMCAFVALVVAASSHGHLEHSQIARNYTLLVLLLGVALYGLMRVCEQPLSPSAPLLVGVSATLALYTHAIAAIYLSTMAAAALFVALRRRATSPLLGHLLAAFGVSGALWMIWLLRVPLGSHVLDWFGTLDSFDELTWGLARTVTAYRAPGLVVWGIAVVGGARALSGPRALSGAMVLMLAVAAPLVIVAVHMVRPLLIWRILLPCLLGVGLGLGLAAEQLCRQSSRRRSWLIGGLACVLALASTASTTRTHEQPWETVVGHLTRPPQPDVILLCPFWAMQVLGYYTVKSGLQRPVFGWTEHWPPRATDVQHVSVEEVRRVLSLPVDEPPPREQPAALEAVTRGRERVSVVVWDSVCVGTPTPAQRLEQLEGMGFRPASGGPNRFGGVTVFEFSRAPNRGTPLPAITPSSTER